MKNNQVFHSFNSEILSQSPFCVTQSISEYFVNLLYVLTRSFREELNNVHRMEHNYLTYNDKINEFTRNNVDGTT